MKKQLNKAYKKGYRRAIIDMMMFIAFESACLTVFFAWVLR